MMRSKTNQALAGIVAILIAGLLAMPMVSVAQDKAGNKTKEKGKAGTSVSGPGKCPVCTMYRSMKHCTDTMARLKQVLSEAKSAAEAEGAKTALAKINEAMELVDKQCKGMMDETMDGKACPMCGKMMGQRKIVNARCPIMGTKLDPDKIPPDLTREWKGRKIGFCCAGCPQKWDKLSDEERQKKLEAAIDRPKEGEN